MNSKKLKHYQCKGKFREVVTKFTYHNPWTKEITSVAWPLLETVVLRKCWKCGTERIPEETLSMIAEKADRIKGMGKMDVIKAGDEDHYVYKMYTALRKHNHDGLPPVRLTREGPSVLASLMREKDEVVKAYPLQQLRDAGAVDDIEYMSAVFRLGVLTDLLEEDPDNVSVRDLGFQTLEQIRSASRRILDASGAS